MAWRANMECHADRRRLRRDEDVQERTNPRKKLITKGHGRGPTHPSSRASRGLTESAIHGLPHFPSHSLSLFSTFFFFLLVLLLAQRWQEGAHERRGGGCSAGQGGGIVAFRGIASFVFFDLWILAFQPADDLKLPLVANLLPVENVPL